MRLIVEGNIAEWARMSLIVAGVVMLICGLSLDFLPRFIAVVLVVLGLPVAAVGGYASRAQALGLRPFDNSYEKARKSYEASDVEQDKL
ncbi:hypothetical protein [Paraburkholderia caribensis]|jgi:hypothetical protein|uniref:hypothetical protein n=1 Tax=Paraburkholderia caribensis TaxID=75105 RepID=UPI0034D27729